MRKNKLIALIGTLTMAAAGLAVLTTISVSKENAIETSAGTLTTKKRVYCDSSNWGGWGHYIACDSGINLMPAVPSKSNLYYYDLPSGTTWFKFLNSNSWDDWQSDENNDPTEGYNYYKIKWLKDDGKRITNESKDWFNPDVDTGWYVTGTSASWSDPGTKMEKIADNQYRLRYLNANANDEILVYSYDSNHFRTQHSANSATSYSSGYTVEKSGNNAKIVTKGIYKVDVYTREGTADCDYAFNIETWTVSYKPGASGTGDETASTKTYGQTLTLKGSTFTRSGYTQTGWSKIDNGDKNFELNGSYTENADLTLYPYWTEDAADTYTVAFNSNGGSGTMDSIVTEVGNPTTIPTCEFTAPTGKKFKEWNDKNDGTGTTYTTSVPSQPKNTTKTLYAIWRNNDPSDGYYVEINGSTRQALTLKQGSSTEYEGSFTLAVNDEFVIAQYADEEVEHTYGFQDLQGQPGTARAKGQLVEGTNDKIKAAAPGTYTVAFHTDYASGRTYIGALADSYTITINGVSQPLVTHQGNEIKTATNVDVEAGDILAVYNNGLLQTMNPKFVSNNNCKSVEGVSTVVVDGNGTIYVDTVNKTIFVGGFDAGTFYMVVTDNAGVDYVKLNKNATPQSDCDEYLTTGEYPFAEDDVISYINTNSADGHIVPFDVATVDPASLNKNFDTSGTKIICTETTDSFAYLKLGKDDKQGQNSVYFGNVDVQLAVDFAKTFVSKLGATCTPGTGQDYGWKDQIGIDWAAESAAFEAIKNDSAKNLLKNASASSSYEDLAKFASLYDYIYGKYHATHDTIITDFAGRNPSVQSGSRNLLSVDNVSSSTWIIVSVAIVGIASVGVFFIYRKRKEN